MDPDLCYVGKEPCGCVVVAIVDNPEHWSLTAKELRKAERAGLTIERITVGEARPLIVRCPHKDAPKATKQPARAEQGALL